MRKLLFFCILSVGLSVSALAQPYTYYPYGGSTATPFTVPIDITDEANLAGIYQGDSVMLTTHFDQVSAGQAAWFGPDGDVGKTMIHGTPIPASNPLTQAQWVNYPRECYEKDQAALGNTTTQLTTTAFNWNPASFEQNKGNIFFYTINFPKAGKYNFFIRVRGGTNNDGSAHTVSVLDKSDISKSIKDISFSTVGINIAGGAAPADGKMSDDNSSKYIALAKTPNLGNAQANSIWIKAMDEIQIKNPGSYVLKVSQTLGGLQNSMGGFTLIMSEKAAEASFTLTSNISSATVMQDSSQAIIFTLKNNGPDGILKDIFVDFASANIAVSSSDSNFSGTKWTIPGGLANGASANIALTVIPEVLGKLQIVPQIGSSFDDGPLGPHSAGTITINSIEPFVPVVPVSLWVVIAAFGGLFGMNILRKRRKRK